MAENGEPVRVVDNAESHRYEIFVGTSLAGFSTYKSQPDAIVITHSEMFPAFEHRGLGGLLAQASLDDIRGPRAAVVRAVPIRPQVRPRSSRIRGSGEALRPNRPALPHDRGTERRAIT